MLQVIKSESCGISAIFFQCCLIIEIQVLMTVPDFFWIFSWNHFLEGGFTFQWGGASFLRGGGTPSILMGRISKKIIGWGWDGEGGWGVPPMPLHPPTMGNLEFIFSTLGFIIIVTLQRNSFS